MKTIGRVQVLEEEEIDVEIASRRNVFGEYTGWLNIGKKEFDYNAIKYDITVMVYVESGRIRPRKNSKPDYCASASLKESYYDMLDGVIDNQTLSRLYKTHFTQSLKPDKDVTIEDLMDFCHEAIQKDINGIPDKVNATEEIHSKICRKVAAVKQEFPNLFVINVLK